MKYRPEIRFADIDSYGIVHNAKFLLYFEQSRIHLFKHIAGEWDWEVRGVLVASQKIDYRLPVTLNDILEVTIWVESLGSKSITCAYQAHIIKGEKRLLAAESVTVIVCYDAKNKITVSVPQEWRDSITSNNLIGLSES
jgi:YbgC/YbaW family acyl-CoA thioester hydrolase